MVHKVLICDDEFPITKAAELKLTKAGYAVIVRHDGEAAWSAYEAGRPDILVSDLQMPRLSGLGLIRRIRERDTALPVILLTAKGYELDEAALKAEFGAFRLFTKPFSPRELADMVGQMLAEATASAAAVS